MPVRHGCGLLVGVMVSLALTDVGKVQAQSREVIEIVAERFVFTPSRIEIAQGDTVEIRIRSEDTDHGFHLVGRHHVIVPKRRHGEAVVVFDADELGVYRFECSKLCGAGHNFMRGEIVVTPRADHDVAAVVPAECVGADTCEALVEARNDDS